MRGDLHRLGVDSFEVLRRFAPLALVAAAGGTAAFVFLLGLVVIWAHELQAFAVSLVALAAALDSSGKPKKPKPEKRT